MIDEYEEKQLFELRDSLRKAERDFEAKDKVAKAAKKRMEAEQKEFNEYVDDLANPTARLPLKDDAASTPIPDGDGPTTPDAVPVGPNPDGEDYRVVEDDERWRLTPMEDLIAHGLSAGDIKRLLNAKPPISSLGELADFTADGNHRLVDIPGVGEKSADRITDAVIGWHEAHPTRKIAKEKPVSDTAEKSSQDASGDGDGESPGHTSEDHSGAILDDPGVVPVDTGGNGDGLEDDDMESVDESIDDDGGQY